jgi:hypothetical protein
MRKKPPEIALEQMGRSTMIATDTTRMNSLMKTLHLMIDAIRSETNWQGTNETPNGVAIVKF